MFDFSTAQGDIKAALSEPNSALLTKDIASKYFGNWKLAMGKRLKLYGEIITVKGILNNPPSNTDFPLSVVISYATLVKNIDMNDWGSISDQNYCFVQLNNNSSLSQFNKLLADLLISILNPLTLAMIFRLSH